MKRRVISSGDFRGMSSSEVVLVEKSSEPLGHELVNPFAVHKSSSLDLVGLAEEIQKADSYISATTSNKLKLIAEQMRYLKKQAESVLLEAKRNSHLHHVACNFQKIPGKVYHLYERSSGQQFFSLISPEEWGSALTHKYLGSFCLERDMSWTPSDQIGSPEVKNNLYLLNEVLNIEHRTSNNKSSEEMMIDF